MARDSDHSGSNKAVLWIVFGIVGGFTFLCAGIVVLWVMAMMSLGTSANVTFGKVASKSATVAKTDGSKQNAIRVGSVTLEIEGQDLDGKSFKLSDYRGKVVMLDFWGHW